MPFCIQLLLFLFLLPFGMTLFLFGSGRQRLSSASLAVLEVIFHILTCKRVHLKHLVIMVLLFHSLVFRRQLLHLLLLASVLQGFSTTFLHFLLVCLNIFLTFRLQSTIHNPFLDPLEVLFLLVLTDASGFLATELQGLSTFPIHLQQVLLGVSFSFHLQQEGFGFLFLGQRSKFLHCLGMSATLSVSTSQTLTALFRHLLSIGICVSFTIHFQ
mmetsp:Transcript_10772/g.26041  ORF Transcript_10772/g.26041 Transcript_10772/m.26041 type:complete len:214 (+) Transcript_10772:220-861(+)